MKHTIFKSIPGYEFLDGHPIAVKFEIYEDSGGGLYLCILDNAGNCVRVFENFEYSNGPSLLEALMLLSEDKTCYELWEGDLCERIGYTSDAIYEAGLGDLIADNDGVWIRRLGFAGTEALGIKEDWDED